MNKVNGYVEIDSSVLREMCEEMLKKIKEANEKDREEAIFRVIRENRENTWFGFGRPIYISEEEAIQILENQPFGSSWNYGNKVAMDIARQFIIASEYDSTVLVATDFFGTYNYWCKK
jgi:hypothetical protein